MAGGVSPGLYAVVCWYVSIIDCTGQVERDLGSLRKVLETHVGPTDGQNVALLAQLRFIWMVRSVKRTSLCMSTPAKVTHMEHQGSRMLRLGFQKLRGPRLWGRRSPHSCERALNDGSSCTADVSTAALWLQSRRSRQGPGQALTYGSRPARSTQRMFACRYPVPSHLSRSSVAVCRHWSGRPENCPVLRRALSSMGGLFWCYSPGQRCRA